MTDTNETSATARRPAKSPDAFRTISEVAAELEVPQHVLRFWESKFAQIKPLKRGGGRRYYRPEDVELLRSIRHLLYDDGYTIKGVQKLLRENGTRTPVDTLRSRQVGKSITVEADEVWEDASTPELSDGQRRKLTAVLLELNELCALLKSAGG